MSLGQYQVQAVLERRMWEAVDTVGPGHVDDPKTSVAFLALDGCALGLYAGVYPAHAAWWNRALQAVSTYAGLQAPRPRAKDLPGGQNCYPMRHESPLVDAVLTLVQYGGLRSLTLDRIAAAAHRDPAWLRSMYGSADELLAEVFDRVLSDGFDEMAPLHLTPSPAGVRSALEALADDRRVAAVLRAMALSGVEISEGAALATHQLSPVVRRDVGGLSDAQWVAALAIDAWALGSDADGPYGTHAMDARVLAELQRALS